MVGLGAGRNPFLIQSEAKVECGHCLGATTFNGDTGLQRAEPPHGTTRTPPGVQLG